MKHIQSKTYFTLFITLLAVTSQLFADLKPLEDWMNSLVDEGKVVGCMAEVTQGGETIFLEAIGNRSPESEEDLTTEQVIRIYSMSKAITSAAIMQLVEQGKLGIDDPVSMYIPSFATVQVYEDGELRPANKEITIRELLTHTSGIAYDFSAPDELKSYYTDKFVDVTSLEDAANIIATLPLVDDPGDIYIYGLSIDVLGRVIEVVAGLSFEVYLQANIFEPLGMRKTGFTPASDVVQMPIVNRTEKGLQIDTVHYESQRDALNPSFQSGGGGLWSTIGDYTRFCQAMEQYGVLDHKRILNHETVLFMTQNHISPGLNVDKNIQQRTYFGLGFGLSPAVLTSKGMKGAWRWTWGGAASTYFFIDPAQDVTAVFATQLFPFDFALNHEFHQVVLESLAQQ